MGRMPHVSWGVSPSGLNWPVLLLVALVVVILLAALIAVFARKKAANGWPRAPFVDVLEGEDETVLVVELPGVSEDEIRVEMADDLVTVETTGERRYVKDIVLEETVVNATVQRDYRAGLLTLRISRPARAADSTTVVVPTPPSAQGSSNFTRLRPAAGRVWPE